MEPLRYNRSFKNGIAVLLLCCLLFGSVIGFFTVSKIQYNRLVSGMRPLEATVTDIDFKRHYRGPHEQKVEIEYTVDGTVYRRELQTDTTISFAAGRGAHYAVGDRVKIFYDPQNPQIIAVPRSLTVGYFFLGIGVCGMSLVLFVLVAMLKQRRSFLVTQAEYDQEKADRK